MDQKHNPNSVFRILIASLAGTTIEFFDFYIYATAAVIVFPKLFFPTTDTTSGTLESLATFALAFFARPVGSALFGHFGDRFGRKTTLVASLMTMGISTIAIGFLPTYSSIGIAAPILLAFFRFGQGVGLGGEWGGAVLLATENAPEGKKAWYGMFPQLGAPLGFIFSSGIFLIIGKLMTNEQFISYGWRIPFILSFILVAVGLYVRLRIIETPDFLKIVEKNQRVRLSHCRCVYQIYKGIGAGHIDLYSHLPDLLHDDGVHAELGNLCIKLFPFQFSFGTTDLDALFRSRHSDLICIGGKI